jgi:hypothetical protein
VKKPKLTKDVLNNLLLLRVYALQYIPGTVWEDNVVMEDTFAYIQQLGEWYYEEGAGQLFMGEEND